MNTHTHTHTHARACHSPVLDQHAVILVREDSNQTCCGFLRIVTDSPHAAVSVMLNRKMLMCMSRTARIGNGSLYLGMHSHKMLHQILLFLSSSPPFANVRDHAVTRRAFGSPARASFFQKAFIARFDLISYQQIATPSFQAPAISREVRNDSDHANE